MTRVVRQPNLSELGQTRELERICNSKILLYLVQPIGVQYY